MICGPSTDYSSVLFMTQPLPTDHWDKISGSAVLGSEIGRKREQPLARYAKSILPDFSVGKFVLEKLRRWSYVAPRCRGR